MEKSKLIHRTSIASLLELIPTEFGWGCTVSKACIMSWLIQKYNLRTTVDVGVYTGRSFFPQAYAHYNFTGGCVYGIDPYTKESAEQYDTPELQDCFNQFLEKTDFESIHGSVDALILTLGYESNCKLIKERSDNAVNFFIKNNIKIDLIHIDGNHDTKNVMKDVELYLPLLNKNSFIILDDISWHSIQPAYTLLLSNYSLVYKQRDTQNDYAIFTNSYSFFKKWMLHFRIKHIAKMA